jgi:hypothetical protein
MSDQSTIVSVIALPQKKEAPTDRASFIIHSVETCYGRTDAMA